MDSPKLLKCDRQIQIFKNYFYSNRNRLQIVFSVDYISKKKHKIWTIIWNYASNICVKKPNKPVEIVTDQKTDTN
jgi:hypothetical protein